MAILRGLIGKKSAGVFDIVFTRPGKGINSADPRDFLFRPPGVSVDLCPLVSGTIRVGQGASGSVNIGRAFNTMPIIFCQKLITTTTMHLPATGTFFVSYTKTSTRFIIHNVGVTANFYYAVFNNGAP